VQRRTTEAEPNGQSAEADATPSKSARAARLQFERLPAAATGPAPSSDPLATRIDGGLALLYPDCTETEVGVAGAISFAYTDLQKYGISETIPSIIRHVRASIPASMVPTGCKQIVAAYLVLREG
jgi:hypothetical protein